MLRDALVKAFVGSPLPWIPLPQLPTILRVDADVAAELLSEAQRQDLVDVWVADHEPRLAPTVLGAQRLGIELRDDNRWYRVGAPRAKKLQRSLGRMQSLAEIEHLIFDRGREPDWDARSGDRKGLTKSLPYPAHLVGTNHLWNTAAPGQPCGACGGRRLYGITYCIYCDRYSLDRLLPLRGRTEGCSRSRAGKKLWEGSVPASRPRRLPGPT